MKHPRDTFECTVEVADYAVPFSGPYRLDFARDGMSWHRQSLKNVDTSTHDALGEGAVEPRDIDGWVVLAPPRHLPPLLPPCYDHNANHGMFGRAKIRAQQYRIGCNMANEAGAGAQRQHFVKNCVRYSIGNPRGFGPRGNTLSSIDISLSLSTRSPAAALSAACSALEAFGIANTRGLRVRNASAT